MSTVAEESPALKQLQNLAISELHAIPELAAFALRVADPELKKGFTAMLADEARHAKSLLEAVELLGGHLDPLPSDDALLSDPMFRGGVTSDDLARFLGRIAHVESQLSSLSQRVVEGIERAELKSEVARFLAYIAKDEERHSAWAREQLDRLFSGGEADSLRAIVAAVSSDEITSLWGYCKKCY